MSSFLVVLSTWLHVLATTLMIGYFLFMCLIYLPIFERQMEPNALRDLLEQVSARVRQFFGGALLIFIVTGTHLMLINESYQGLGNFFGNSWSVLIVIKHVLVLALLLVAIYSERAFMRHISVDEPEALARFRLTLNVNLLLGVLILLLTSIAQVS